MIRKLKENKALEQKQKSRAKYKCPDELKDLIEIVNLLPPETTLPKLSVVIDAVKEVSTGLTDDQNPIYYLHIAVNHCLSDTPEEFQAYIYGATKGRRSLSYNGTFGEKIANAYLEFCSLRDSMYQLIKYLKIERERKEKYPDIRFIVDRMLPHNIRLPIVTLETILKRDKFGNLQLTGLTNLIGKFDDSRLRSCLICNRIFWAKREDSQTCSPRCFGVLRTRRYRNLTNEEKAERKAQREVNKNYKQTPKRSKK